MTNKRWTLPAVVIALIGLVMVLYSWFAFPSDQPPGPPPGTQASPVPGAQMPQGRPPKGGIEWLNLFGTAAIICAAVSFAWLGFKKKLGSPVGWIKKLGKALYGLHTYTGWIALVLVAVHGGSYLVTKPVGKQTATGIAALLLLAALAMYGWLFRRARHAVIRSMHFLLAVLWIPFVLLHAGGSALITAAITCAALALVGIIDKSARGSNREPSS